MAFESLSERLGKAFKNITGKGKLSEKNMNCARCVCRCWRPMLITASLRISLPA